MITGDSQILRAESHMKKDECEQAIRALCHTWREVRGLLNIAPGDLSFLDFKSWARENYPRYFKFRTSTSVDYDTEMWFDQEFHQTWRR